MIKEKSRKKNLLFVLNSFEILMSSGKGIEETIEIISKNSYGTISSDFREVVGKTKDNYMSLDEALLSVRRKTNLPYYKQLLEYLAFSYKNKTDILENIIRLGKIEIREQQNMHLRYENFATTLMDVYILFAFIPILILNIVIIAFKMMSENALFLYFGIIIPLVTNVEILLYYSVNTLILTILVAYVYVENPNNK